MAIVSMDNTEFNEYKTFWKEKITDIKLPEDINSEIGKVILSQLDEAYAYIRIEYAEIEAARDRADSIIRENERSKAEGSNEDNRRKNATEYLQHYPVGQDEVNMYEWSRMLNSRFSVLKSFLKVIENKQQRLITMTGLIKIDTSIGNGQYV